MSAQGWAAKSFFAGFYQFEACEKGEYVYQIDFGTKLFAASEDYREFMREAGIELVQTWGYWIILRKKASEGNFELYTHEPNADPLRGHPHGEGGNPQNVQGGDNF